MLYQKNIGEWETWHHLYLTGSETERAFLTANESYGCWRRNGGNWQRYNGGYASVLRPEVDTWMRSAAGHSTGEVWECDRIYYEHETPPELPTGGGVREWRERFICYPDRDRRYNTYAWTAGRYNGDKRGIRSYVGFQEGFIRGPHKAEHLPVIFAMLFL
jgi:hypothetical protein